MNLSIAVLIGGNEISQEKFYTSLNEKSGNFEGEVKHFKVVEKIKNKLEVCFESIRRTFEDKFEQVVSIVIDDNDDEANNGIADISEKLSSATKIYRFLQLLCEGHNLKLQHYMREQFTKDDSRYALNINFVRYTALSFGGFAKYVNPRVINLGNQMIDFLVEIIQGPCKENQITLYDSKIIDYCKDLMNEFQTERDYAVKGFAKDKESIDELIKNSVKFLNSLLEGNKNEEMLNYMSFNLDFEYLSNLLTDEFVSFFEKLKISRTQLKDYTVERLNSLLKMPHFDDDISEAFDIYFLISTFKEDFKNLKPAPADNHDVLNSLAYEFFKHHSGKIQIVFSDDELYDIPFIIQPACQNVDPATKLVVILGLNRNTAKDKIISFMNACPKLFELIEHLSELRQHRGFIFRNTFFSQLKVFSLLVAI